MNKQIINIVKRELFPHLKLKDKNLSLTKKIYVYVNIFFELWIIVYLCLYFLLPYVAQDKYRYKNITFYTYNNVYDVNASNYFNNIKNTIVANKLYNKNISIDIYLLNNASMYYILNPIEWLPHRQTFAVTYNKKVFIKDADIKRNKAYASNDADENLDAIMVHEAVHVMQNSTYGFFYMAFKMPYWVKEGYPIYSARPLSEYKEKEIIEYIKKTNDIEISKWNIFDQDQFHGLMVKHAIEKMHKSVDDLHLGKVSYDEVYESLLKEYNITQSKQ